MSEPASSASLNPKRSRRRTLALGCAGVFGLLVICFVALAIIGLIAGEGEETDPVESAISIVSPAKQSSYTVHPYSGMSIER